MNDPLALLLAWMVGGALGSFFFGGLWWTVSQLSESRRPALLIVSSFLLRTSVALGGVYMVVATGHWDRLVLCMFGFFLARFATTRLIKSPVFARGPRVEEPNHASESR